MRQDIVNNSFIISLCIPCWGLTLFILLLLGGCATHVQNMPHNTDNPPPSTPFSNYRHVKIEPVQLAAEYADDSANQWALKHIQEHFDAHFSSILKAWKNKKRDTLYGTLVIKPRIVELKYVSEARRRWLGSYAGSSVVVMHVDYWDEANSNLIGHAEFYQKASALGGVYSVGSTDNNMLRRIAVLVAEFTRNNFGQAVGGITGAEHRAR